MRQIVGFALFVGLHFSATIASAEYICNTRHNPGSTSLGDYGFIEASIYTGPDCTGSYFGTWYLCSTGATDSECAGPPQYRFTSAEQLAAVFAPIAEAAGENYPASRATVWCIGGGGSCLAYIRFD